MDHVPTPIRESKVFKILNILLQFSSVTKKDLEKLTPQTTVVQIVNSVKDYKKKVPEPGTPQTKVEKFSKQL